MFGLWGYCMSTTQRYDTHKGGVCGFPELDLFANSWLMCTNTIWNEFNVADSADERA